MQISRSLNTKGDVKVTGKSAVCHISHKTGKARVSIKEKEEILLMYLWSNNSICSEITDFIRAWDRHRCCHLD